MAGMGQVKDGLGADTEDLRPQAPSGLKWGSHQPQSGMQGQGPEDFLEPSGTFWNCGGRAQEGIGKQSSNPLAVQMRPEGGTGHSQITSRQPGPHLQAFPSLRPGAPGLPQSWDAANRPAPSKLWGPSKLSGPGSQVANRPRAPPSAPGRVPGRGVSHEEGWRPSVSRTPLSPDR